MQIRKQSMRFKNTSPKKDFFVEGQLGVRKPEVKKQLNEFSRYQRYQTDKLAAPKRNSERNLNLTINSGFLRKSTHRLDDMTSLKSGMNSPGELNSPASPKSPGSSLPQMLKA